MAKQTWNGEQLAAEMVFGHNHDPSFQRDMRSAFAQGYRVGSVSAAMGQFEKDCAAVCPWCDEVLRGLHHTEPAVLVDGLWWRHLIKFETFTDEIPCRAHPIRVAWAAANK